MFMDLTILSKISLAEFKILTNFGQILKGNQLGGIDDFDKF